MWQRHFQQLHELLPYVHDVGVVKVLVYVCSGKAVGNLGGNEEGVDEDVTKLVQRDIPNSGEHLFQFATNV